VQVDAVEKALGHEDGLQQIEPDAEGNPESCEKQQEIQKYQNPIKRMVFSAGHITFQKPLMNCPE